MNIFLVHPRTETCAQVLDDIRLKAMTKETAQLLSTAIRVWDEPEAEQVYKPFVPNHPVNLWVRHCIEHFSWTTELLWALGDEYRYRNGKPHASAEKLREPAMRVATRYNPKGDLTFSYWLNDTPYQDRHPMDAYQQTLLDKWELDRSKGVEPKWTRRGAPWFVAIQTVDI